MLSGAFIMAALAYTSATFDGQNCHLPLDMRRAPGSQIAKIHHAERSPQRRTCWPPVGTFWWPLTPVLQERSSRSCELPRVARRTHPGAAETTEPVFSEKSVPEVSIETTATTIAGETTAVPAGLLTAESSAEFAAMFAVADYCDESPRRSTVVCAADVTHLGRR